MSRYILPLACLLGLLGVALGAFGAHWLRGAVEQWGLTPELQTRRLENWETAVRYQLYHALALLFVGWFAQQRPAAKLPAVAAVLFLVGILIFSGCLYALVLSGRTWLGAVVPLGGTSLLAGWLALALATWPTAAQHNSSGKNG